MRLDRLSSFAKLKQDFRLPTPILTIILRSSNSRSGTLVQQGSSRLLVKFLGNFRSAFKEQRLSLRKPKIIRGVQRFHAVYNRTLYGLYISSNVIGLRFPAPYNHWRSWSENLQENMDVPAFSKCFPPNVPELLVTLQLSCLKLPKWSEITKRMALKRLLFPEPLKPDSSRSIGAWGVLYVCQRWFMTWWPYAISFVWEEIFFQTGNACPIYVQINRSIRWLGQWLSYYIKFLHGCISIAKVNTLRTRPTMTFTPGWKSSWRLTWHSWSPSFRICWRDSTNLATNWGAIVWAKWSKILIVATVMSAMLIVAWLGDYPQKKNTKSSFICSAGLAYIN